MKTLEELQRMAKTKEIKNLGRKLSSSTFEKLIDSSAKLDRDLMAAVLLSKDEFGLSQVSVTMHVLDVVDSEHVIRFLEACEVPHFNLYDIDISTGMRIPDYLTSMLNPFDGNALRNSRIEGVLKWVIPKTTDINLETHVKSLLFTAICKGNISIIRLLHDHGADFDAIMDTHTCDHWANYYGDRFDEFKEFRKDFIAFRNEMRLADKTVAARAGRAPI